MKSTYRNWRKTEINAKANDISSSFPVHATRNFKNGIDIKFENEKGERINFSLNEHDTKLMFMQIDINYHKKPVTREDYNLDELYFLNK